MGSKPARAASASALEVNAFESEASEVPPKDVAGCESGREAIATAMEALRANDATSADLQLSSLQIEDVGVIEIAKVMASSTHLVVLNLGVNKLTDVGAEALAAELPRTRLKVLNLERNSLTSVGIAPLANSLPTTLEKLLIGRNTLGWEGAQVLATSTMQLHTLGLGFANLREEGAKALAPLLSRLKVLDISGNHIGGAGCIALAYQLRSNPGLETLKLESNGVGDEGAHALALALGSNTTLQVLELRRNSVTDQGAKSLASVIVKNTTLRTLDLFDNNITDDGASSLLCALESGQKVGSKLTKLDLEINDVSRELIANILSRLQS